MRLKISFENQEQQDKMKEFIEKDHAQDCEIERLAEKLMQLQIQPHMFRELSNKVKEDKQFFNGVVIEIEEQQVVQNNENDADEEYKQQNDSNNNQPAKKSKKKHQE